MQNNGPIGSWIRCERLADPHACAPQNRDQGTEAVCVRAWPGLAHHEDGLLDRRRVGRVAQPLFGGAHPAQ